MSAIVSYLSFDTAATPVSALVSFLSFDTAYVPVQQNQTYGGIGHVNRDDVEKWWELVELRNAEEAKSQVIQPTIEAKTSAIDLAIPSIDQPVPDIQLHNPFAAPLLPSAPIQLSQSVEVVKPRKVPNDDALILLLLNM